MLTTTPPPIDVDQYVTDLFAQHYEYWVCVNVRNGDPPRPTLDQLEGSSGINRYQIRRRLRPAHEAVRPGGKPRISPPRDDP